MSKTYSFPMSMRPGETKDGIETVDFGIQIGVDFAKAQDELKTMILRVGQPQHGKTAQMSALVEHCIPKKDAWIAGPAPWGKSIIDEINQQQTKQILTLQKEIEHLKTQLACAESIIDVLEGKLKKERKKIKKLVEESVKQHEAEKIAKAQRQREQEKHGRNILV